MTIAHTHLQLTYAFSLDDIEFWVGGGANRAAVVVDWADSSTELPALAWGYRWDGVASGSDMLAAVITADPRLFAKLRGARTNPDAVFGLGYDADDDGTFNLDDGTAFDSAGFAFTAEPADGAAATSPADYYAEGWFAGFWHYGVAASNPFDGGIWTDSTLGMTSRMLSDGAWDSWVFESPITFTGYAANPQPAEPPFSPGDFNHDGQVDPADYQVWQRTYGSIDARDADGNLNGTIDAADFVVWRGNVTADATDSLATVMFAIPEPETISLLLVALLWIRLAIRETANGRSWVHIISAH